jgi:hypothetical protein
MQKKSRVPPKIQRYIVLPDIHCPYEDKKSLAAVESLMGDYFFDGYIQIGDLLDLDCISSHNIGNLRGVENKRIFDDYKVAVALLDRHQSIIRKRNKNARFVVLEGNHEYRLTRFIDANPSLAGLIEIPFALDFERRKIEWIPYWSTGEVLQIGKAMFGHGKYINDGHAKKHVMRYGSDFFYGPTHDIQSYSLEQYGKTLIGQSLGCLCLPQQYMHGAPDKWSQAFAVFEFLPSGFFDYRVVRIHDHKFVYKFTS